jgi:hypothetical protein
MTSELERVTEEHAHEVCKIGQGAECCRYLTIGAKGWSCEKTYPRGKAIIDRQVEHGMWTAKGDNCDGRLSL